MAADLKWTRFGCLAVVTPVDLGRRSRRLHGREGLKDAIAVLGACGNERNRQVRA